MQSSRGRNTAIAHARPARHEAEAALVGQYPRLVRLAHLILPPTLGRHRRVVTAHGLVQGALAGTRTGRQDRAAPPYPAGPAGMSPPPGRPRLPEPRPAADDSPVPEDPAYAWLRARVVRSALRHGRRLPRTPLPAVFGLRLFPRSGGAAELGLDRALSEVAAPVRAALGLHLLEGLDESATIRLLAAAGVTDPGAAVRTAARLAAGAGHPTTEPPPPAGTAEPPTAESLLLSSEFDPCTVHLRPTDLLRRRRRIRWAAALAATLAAAGGVLLPRAGQLPADRPSAARAAVDAALDPAALRRTSPDAWADTSRVDFTAWPARGTRTADIPLLGRALRAWGTYGRPGLRAGADPDTATGAPTVPPRLLYAGQVGRNLVVLLHDGERLARYTEALDATGAPELRLARADGADVTTAAAVVLARTPSGTRYLLAPWIAGSGTRDLLAPGTPARPLPTAPDGVTAPVPAPEAGPGAEPPGGTIPPAAPDCTRHPALQLRSSARIVEKHGFLVADLGGLLPAHLTWTPPPGAGAPARQPREATGRAALDSWARSACRLAGLREAGVRAVNRWDFAGQDLPGAGGRASWVCLRADTWEGTGRVSVTLEVPGRRPAAVETHPVREAHGTAACSRFGQDMLAGAVWAAPSGVRWFLAAGSRRVRTVEAAGPVSASAPGRFLAVRLPAARTAAAGGGVRLSGTLDSGPRLDGWTPGTGTLPPATGVRSEPARPPLRDGRSPAPAARAAPSSPPR
ncbi:hypothetical protein [Streptomyces sp. NPDC086023]|uniref:hypothetical protein n=1 Tax=Streptomyces sp. NPDC086023 TaxID=3365746 RepID=UPI0037D86F2C